MAAQFLATFSIAAIPGIFLFILSTYPDISDWAEGLLTKWGLIIFGSSLIGMVASGIAMVWGF